METVEYDPPSEPMFWFEANFDIESHKEWLDAHWRKYLYTIPIYYIVVFGIQAYLKDKPAFNLRASLVLWNLGLAVFSIVGLYRVFPEFLYSLREFGYNYSVCNPSFLLQNKVTAFWSWAFAMSKVCELGDTVFTVLRKQKLIFLHWYHHSVVVFYCWFTVYDHPSYHRWLMWINFTVHACMYSYYALRAATIRLPAPVAMTITLMGISQMVHGCFINLYVYFQLYTGEDCHVKQETVFLGFTMYLVFLLFFVYFFRKIFCVPKVADDKQD